MQGGFTKGLIVGGIIGASVSMAMGPDMMKNRTRKRMMKQGRSFLRRSGNIVGDVLDVFR
jgi:gas vesicle protein